MRFTRRILFGILTGVVASGFSACDKTQKDEPTPEGPEGALTGVIAPVVTPGAVDPSVTGVLSTTEAGNYIETTAKQLDEICNPQDQKEAVNALVEIAEVLDSYDFNTEEPQLAKSLARAARKMARGAKGGDFAAVPRAAQEVVYDLEVSPYAYTGVYTPVYDNEEEEFVWTRTADSANQIIFRSEKDGVDVVMTVSSNSWTGKFTTTDYDYDYVNGNYQEYDIINNWTVRVPAQVNLNMGYRGESAASAVVVSNFNESGHTLEVKASAKLANIIANAQVSGTDTKVTEISDATVGGTRIFYSTAEVTGNGLCDRQKLENIFSQDQEVIAEQIDNLFTGATVKANILERIQLESKCSSLRELVKAGDYDDEVQAEVDAFANALNNAVKTNLYFGNTGYDQGSLTWGVMPVTDYWITYYEVSPMIQLASGGSPMSVEEFFDSDTLKGAIKAIEQIINAYGKLFD
ncbi:MAG: hypothetical protein K2K97_07470 [Muribaculaceae bacterium]|nr:hypothetical protein [Muribaculaceae bacterium]